MKKMLWIFILVLNNNLICMEDVDIGKIKKAFEAKIEWTKENGRIFITSATIPGLLNLTKVHVPESMKQEFESFFSETKNQEEVRALTNISQAIESSKQCKIKKYNQYKSNWPKSVVAVANIYKK